MARKALFIATVGGFVTQFEMNNVAILQRMGYEVHSAANFTDSVYCVKEQELKKAGVILHHIDIEKSPFMLRQNTKALSQIRRIIRQEGISLIHCHTPVGGLLGRIAGVTCPEAKPQIIYTAHGFHFYTGAPRFNWVFYYTVERLLARATDCLVTINEEDFDRAKKFHLRKDGRVFRIPGEGLHIENFTPVSREEKARLRKSLNIEPDDFFILSVGELSGNKNHRMIIDLIPRLMERIPDRKVCYGICGDGYFRSDIQRRLSAMNLLDNVHMFGYRKDIPRILACADCFLFPSVREGLGMAALEAMAMEIPVVAADNRGTREYMRPGVNGLVCDPHRPEDFLDALAVISRMPEEKLRRMGREGRKVAEMFRLEKTQPIMEEAYRFADQR